MKAWSLYLFICVYLVSQKICERPPLHEREEHVSNQRCETDLL